MKRHVRASGKSDAPTLSSSLKRELGEFSEDGWARSNTVADYSAYANRVPYGDFDKNPIVDEEDRNEAVVEQVDESVNTAEYGDEYADDYARYYTAADYADAAEGATEDKVEDGEEYEYEAGAEEYEGEAGEAELEYELSDGTIDGVGEAVEKRELYYERTYDDTYDEQPVDAEVVETGDYAEVGDTDGADYREQSSPGDQLTVYSLDDINKRVAVRKVEGKGRCLYTRHELDPGDIIFVEAPVLVVIPSLDATLWDLLNKLNGEEAFDLPPIWHLAALCSMTMLDDEERAICLDKWVPNPDQEPSDDVLRVIQYLEDGVDPNLYERMLLVWRYNSFGHHTETYGLVLYNRISMMAHSCRATACWHYGAGDSFILRSRVHLDRGDELTISYIGDEELFKSTDVRREKVQGWLFTCHCVRCDAAVDDARGFRCPSCGTGSTFFQTDDEVVTATPCTLCLKVPSEDTIAQYVEYEKAYADRLSETNKSDMPDAEMVYDQATKLFTQHWVLYQLDTVLFEGYNAAAEYDSAFMHQQQRLAYVSKVMPLSSYSLAWLYEEMGDFLWNRIQAGGRPYSDAKLSVAGRYYEDAYNMLYILCGAEHEYTEAAREKQKKVESFKSSAE